MGPLYFCLARFNFLRTKTPLISLLDKQQSTSKYPLALRASRSKRFNESEGGHQSPLQKGSQ